MLTPLVVGGLLQVMGSVTLVFLIFGVASLVAVLLWWRCTTETAGRELGV
jgi:membrane protein implicated in regulation of membrane protease activity